MASKTKAMTASDIPVEASGPWPACSGNTPPEGEGAGGD